MEGDPRIVGLISLTLVVLNGLFVAAEYGLVGSRRSKIEPLARKGSRSATLLLGAMDRLSEYVAGLQVAITMCGIGIGSIAEPLVHHWLEKLIGTSIPRGITVAVSLLSVTYVLVIVGELVPKYVALARAEQVALSLIVPLRFIITVLKPLVFVVERSGAALLKIAKIEANLHGDEAASRDELMLMVRAGEDQGKLEEAHAQLIQKALRFDVLDAADIMIHRMDIKWVDINATREELLQELSAFHHSRVPVCRGDIDDVVGILYLQDLLQALTTEELDLNKIIRPVEIVPETLVLNRLIQRMREAKTQILIVADEYGGTSGLVTLEDVVEEVFGELDDQLEAEKPAIVRTGANRLSARAEVRYDEILEFLEVEGYEEPSTDTLATIIAERLERVPKLGDKVEDPIGTIWVENMAKRRVTRVRIQLSEVKDGGAGS